MSQVTIQVTGTTEEVLETLRRLGGADTTYTVQLGANLDNVKLDGEESSDVEVSYETKKPAVKTEVEEPKKRHRRTKAEIEAARAAEAAAKKTVVEEDEENAEAEAPDESDDIDTDFEEPKKAAKLSFEKDVIPACVAFTKKFDRDKIKPIFASFGVKSVKDLDASKYEDLIKALRSFKG